VRWFDELLKVLTGAEAGILCLAAENLDSPWLHFEAGVLMTGLHRAQERAAALDADDPLRDRVFTYLLGDAAQRLSGPLAQYQATATTRDETWRLVETLADVLAGGKDHDGRGLSERFEKEWPSFDRNVQAISVKVQTLLPDFESWFREKAFDEALDQCTDQNWIARYENVVRALLRLRENEEAVQAACSRYQVDLYMHLSALVDAYRTDIRALLVRAKRFELDDQTGKLTVPKGKLLACESRRMRIRDVVSRILDPLDVPKTSDAARFWLSDSFELRKLLVHRLELALDDARSREPPLSAEDARAYFKSRWDLDRIYGYLALEKLEKEQSTTDVAWIRVPAEHEVQRCRSSKNAMPLHYALIALETVLRKRSGPPKANEQDLIQRLIDNVRALELEAGGPPVERTLTEIEERLRKDPTPPETAS
jgi:hypothetical protein